MICKNCGKQIKDGVSFCPYCGNSTDKEKENNSVCRTNVKGKLFAISSLCVALILILLLTLLKGGNVPFVSGDKKIINEFVKCLDKEEYDEAYKLLYFTTENKVNLSSGGFKAFAEEYLSECEVIKNADKKYTLKTDSKEFKISVNEDLKKILGDDFLMQYKIKYTSYMTSSQNSFKGKPEKTDNGMMVYTINCFKSSDPIVVDYDMLIGEEVGLSAQARAIIEVDDNYALSKISQIGDRLDGKNTDSTLAYIEDGVLVLDKYGVTQPYAEKIARTFSALITDMLGYAQDNASYETFYKDYSAHVCDTDLLKATYQEILKIQPNLAQFDYIDCTATSWTYPKYFSYSDNSYIMEVTVRMDVYKNGKMPSKDNELTWYVMYQPGKEKLRVYNFDTSKEKLLSRQPDEKVIEPETKIENLSGWKKAYIDYLSDEERDYMDKAGVDSGFSLLYIDDDDIPEIFYDSGYTAGGFELLTYTDTEVQDTWLPYGGFYYIEKQNQYLSSFGRMGSYGDSICKLKNGISEGISGGEYGDKYDENGELVKDADGNLVSEYHWGDALVSEEEYKAQLEKAFDKSIAKSSSDFDTYTRKQIIQKIIDWNVSTSTKQASSQNNGQDQDYILPDCDSRYYSQEELEALSAEQLKLARNEIYARHGYIFQTGNTKNYFDSKTWYRGTVTEVTDDMLNEYEIANRDLIISIEKK